MTRIRSFVRHAFALTAAAWVTAACGGSFSGPSSAPESLTAPSSPSESTTASLAALLQRDPDLDSWKAEARTPFAAAPYDDSSAWGRALSAFIEPHKATAELSAPHRCLAAEIVRFVATAQGMPNDSVRHYLEARCGVVSPMLTPTVWVVSLPEPTTEDAIIDRAVEKVGPIVANSLGAGHRLVGMAASVAPDRAIVSVVVGNDDARLDEADHRTGSDGRAVIAGHANGDYGRVVAFVNRDKTSVAPCTARPGARPPSFAFDCDLAGASEGWVEILGYRPGAMTGTAIAEALLHPGEASAMTYTRPRSAPAATVASTDAFSSAVVDRTNAVRRDLGLPPLAVDAPQSAEVVREMGALFTPGGGSAALMTSEDLLQGKKIDAAVHDSRLCLGLVGTARDPVTWVDFALERPTGRLALLDPGASRIAMGTQTFGAEDISVTAAVAATYEVFTSDDHAADEAALIERISSLRTSHGLPAPVRIHEVDAMTSEAQLVAKEGKDAMAALQAMQGAVVRGARKGVQGFVLMGPRIDDLEIPWQLAQEGPAKLMVHVVHRRVEGTSLAQYVAFVLIVS